MPHRGYTNTTVLSGRSWIGGVRETTTTLTATPADNYTLANSGGYIFYNDARLYRVFEIGTQEPLIWAGTGEEIIIKSIDTGTGNVVFGTSSLASVTLDADVDIIYIISTNLNDITQGQVAELYMIDEWVYDPNWADDGTTLTTRNTRNVDAEIVYDNTTSGLTATNVQDAIDEIDENIDNLSADEISYNNTASGLVATDVQEAIDEVHDDSLQEVAVDDTLTGDGTVADPLGLSGTFTPSADSTTAFQFFKADGVTPVMSLDTTNDQILDKDDEKLSTEKQAIAYSLIFG
jgi:hypothetical protein